MTEIHIENIVALTHVAKTLNLEELSRTIPGTKYNPEEFPGLVFPVNHPTAAIMMFPNGTAFCTGAKTVDDVNNAVQIAQDALKNAGVKVTSKPNITIQHFVASSTLKESINLKALAQSLWLENVTYEPDQFPALVYQMRKPSVELLLFSSGKIVCTGATEKDISTAMTKLTDAISSVGM